LAFYIYITFDQIGNSLFDAPGASKVAGLMEKAKAKNVKVIFPVDSITADKFDKDAKVKKKPSFSCVISTADFMRINLDWYRHRR
jgi:3-phosphoglycerate kinase